VSATRLRLVRDLAVAAAAATTLLLGFQPRPGDPTVSPGLLGPLGELVADVEWIRFQRAHLRGDEALALVHAERALTWNPTESRGWRLLSSHLGLFLASVEREPDPTERARLLAWAVRLTVEGEQRARDPGMLAFHRGLLLLTHADLDPDLDWPGGTREVLEQAAAAFEGASALGVEDAGALAADCRRRIEEP